MIKARPISLRQLKTPHHRTNPPMVRFRYKVIHFQSLLSFPLRCEWATEACEGIKWYFNGALLWYEKAGELKKWAAINGWKIFMVLKMYVVVTFPTPEEMKKTFQFDLHFASWRAVFVAFLRRWWTSGRRRRDTFKNLHLLFGNHAWICIYLHFYFPFHILRHISMGAIRRKKSAEMFISFLIAVGKKFRRLNCDDVIFISRSSRVCSGFQGQARLPELRKNAR